MLTEHEQRFMEYWEKNRDKEKQVFRQWLVGLPVGLAIGVAIVANFFSGWYKRASYVANSSFNPMVLIIAVLIIISFIAIFSKRHKWDMNEQRYQEFKAKAQKERKSDDSNRELES